MIRTSSLRQSCPIRSEDPSLDGIEHSKVHTNHRDEQVDDDNTNDRVKPLPKVLEFGNKTNKRFHHSIDNDDDESKT